MGRFELKYNDRAGAAPGRETGLYTGEERIGGGWHLPTPFMVGVDIKESLSVGFPSSQNVNSNGIHPDEGPGFQILPPCLHQVQWQKS